MTWPFSPALELAVDPAMDAAIDAALSGLAAGAAVRGGQVVAPLAESARLNKKLGERLRAGDGACERRPARLHR
jgi:hypothetical protein